MEQNFPRNMTEHCLVCSFSTPVTQKLVVGPNSDKWHKDYFSWMVRKFPMYQSACRRIG
jgi:hypothetical protein